VEIRVPKEFSGLASAGEKNRKNKISTATTNSADQFRKRIKMTLLVVMTAVDSWKSLRTPTLVGFLIACVQWIFLRPFEKFRI
jgi:hypothetical protein